MAGGTSSDAQPIPVFLQRANGARRSMIARSTFAALTNIEFSVLAGFIFPRGRLTFANSVNFLFPVRAARRVGQGVDNILTAICSSNYDQPQALPPTVYIIDSDPNAREPMVTLVKTIGYPTMSLSSAEEFLEIYRPKLRGCLIAEMKLAGMSGLELQDRLNAIQCDLPFIMVTAFANVPLAVCIMERGAVTMLEKTADPQKLLAAVRKALDKDVQIQKAKVEYQQIEAAMTSLTADERNVLKLLVAGKANKMVAAELDIGLRTVETRRHNIMSKFRAESVADLVRMVLVLEQKPPKLPPGPPSVP